MACADFFAANGYTENTDLATLTNAINQQGISCINANMMFCENECANMTKTQNACYSCLSQVGSCPNQACRSNTFNCAKDPTNQCCPGVSPQAGCCMQAKSAVQCGACVAANSDGSQTLEAFQKCLKSGGMSTSTIIIIVVVSIIGVILIIVTIVVSLRLRKQAAAREKLVKQLQKRGASQKIIAGVENLDYSKISDASFREVDTKLVLSSQPTSSSSSSSSSSTIMSPTDAVNTFDL
jgi:hypothetical protein